MGSIVQIVMLLAQVFPAALKAVQAWQDYHGQELNRERRKQLAADVNSLVHTAVTTKDTSGLEQAIKNLGRPATAAEAPKNPS